MIAWRLLLVAVSVGVAHGAAGLNARKCEFVASDGSHYDISPLFIPARSVSFSIDV
jgi:hypothetical protein